jgi:hypothetical protein
MPGLHRIAAALLVPPLCAVLVACGSQGSDAPGALIARVGGISITNATLVHWVKVLDGGGSSDPPGARGSGLRSRALEFLISSHWLIGEAESRRILIARKEVLQQIDRIEGQTFPGRLPELRQLLKPTGESVGDVELQASAELAAIKLRAFAESSAPPVTTKQIATYYASHKGAYFEPEVRLAWHTNTKKFATAARLKREIEAGETSLPTRAQRHVGEEFAAAHVPPGNDQYEQTIDSIPARKLSGPFHIRNDFFLYEVRVVIPSRQHTLPEVSGPIRRRLGESRRHEALEAFLTSLGARWRAKTDCASGDLVLRCRNFRSAQPVAHLLEL